MADVYDHRVRQCQKDLASQKRWQKEAYDSKSATRVYMEMMSEQHQCAQNEIAIDSDLYKKHSRKIRLICNAGRKIGKLSKLIDSM